jgi:hypothetical protein
MAKETEPVIHMVSEMYIAVYGDYTYYGDMVNGVRSGTGIWFRVWEHDGNDYYVYYKGKWSNDLPNGQGIQVQQEIGTTSLPYTEAGNRVYTGTFTNGLLSGTSINEYHSSYDGRVHRFSADYIMGVAQIKGTRHGTDYIALCEACGDCSFSLGVSDYMARVWGLE